MMRIHSALFLIGLLALVGWMARLVQQESPPVGILSPGPGHALQGNVSVIANTMTEEFEAAELAFAYDEDFTDTWFLLQQASQPITSTVMAQWDTTTITDGNYRLRLVVRRQQGDQLSVVVAGLRVRNYTPIETDTPTPVTPTLTPEPGDTPIPTITSTPTITPLPPTPTALPTNPAELTSEVIALTLARGVLIGSGLLALLGVYVTLQAYVKRR